MLMKCGGGEYERSELCERVEEEAGGKPVGFLMAGMVGPKTSEAS